MNKPPASVPECAVLNDSDEGIATVSLITHESVKQGYKRTIKALVTKLVILTAIAIGELIYIAMKGF